MRLVLLLVLCSGMAFAGPKKTTKDFDTNCPRLWKATKVAAKAHYDVLNLNDQEMSGSVSTGNGFTYVRPLAFELSGTGEKCTIGITGHFWGVIHHDKSDFFDRVGSALKDVPR